MADKEITAEEQHQQDHIRLHRAFDELLACYIAENSGYGCERRASIHDEIYALMKWSHEKTLKPSPVKP
jgi:hypothetical protein